jgi:NAD(P)-dependent dehydrogenase (short-subunit alcohol dehydrogenase family)
VLNDTRWTGLAWIFVDEEHFAKMTARPQAVRSSSTITATKTLVLISGGNAGLGYEMVKKIATEHSSTHHVLIGCRDTHKGETAVASMGAPMNVNPIQLDITSDKSIDLCFKAIEQNFGKLDILINNAGTTGRDLPPGKSLRQVYDHCFSVNATSTALLTEAMTPLLEKSKLPKVIFITSRLGSIVRVLQPNSEFVPTPFYNSSKSAMNMLCAFYAKKHPNWKVNAVCPGLNTTGLNDVEKTEETDPKNGAIRAVQLVLDGPDGVTGTYSEKEGPLPW